MYSQNSQNASDFSALELQTGIQRKNQLQYSRELQFVLKELKCMDLSKDIAFIGAASDADNADAINYV